jgi:hypothetical protein
MRRRAFLGTLAAAILADKMEWATPASGQRLAAAMPAQANQGLATNPIKFEDIAQKGGVHFVTENCPTPEKHQPETMLAGIALFDYDGDGLLDIYLLNGADMPSLVKTSPKYWNRLVSQQR